MLNMLGMLTMLSPLADPFRSLPSRPTVIAVGISLALHATLLLPPVAALIQALALGHSSSAVFVHEATNDPLEDPAALITFVPPEPVAPPPEPPRPAPPPREPEIALGIGDGDPKAISWIGFSDFLEHFARPAETDQAARQLMPSGDEGRAADPMPPAPPSDATMSGPVGVQAPPSPPAPPPTEAEPSVAPPDLTAKPETPERTETPPLDPAPKPTDTPDPKAHPVEEPARDPLAPPTPAPTPEESKPNPKPEPPTDPVPEPKPESKPEPKPEPKPESPAEPGPTSDPAVDPASTPAPPLPEPARPEPGPLDPTAPGDVGPPAPTAPRTEPPPADPIPSSAPAAPPNPPPASSPPDVQPTPPQQQPEDPQPPRPDEQPLPQGVAGPVQPTTAGPRTSNPVGDGEISDMESDATSIINVPPNQWKNGRPIAAKGLTIKTRKPKFTILTLVTSNPRNAIVEIAFDQQGNPKSFGFLRPTGYPDIDGPILDAIAGWRASGAPLEKLKKSDTITVRMRLILSQ